VNDKELTSELLVSNIQSKSAEILDPRFAAFCRKVGLPVPGKAAAQKT
jgi:hypothetical protein